MEGVDGRSRPKESEEDSMENPIGKLVTKQKQTWKASMHGNPSMHEKKMQHVEEEAMDQEARELDPLRCER